MIKAVTVYLGSNVGNSPIYMETACKLGELLACNGITLVYGGSKLGTMNALANGALAYGGKVIGIMPENFLGGETAKEGIEFYSVKDMSERKHLLQQMSDAAIILPGSFGTMDEMFQYAVHKQLGYFNKPIYILNLNGYYNNLFALIEQMTKEGFIKFNYKEFFKIYTSVEEIITDIKKNG